MNDKESTVILAKLNKLQKSVDELREAQTRPAPATQHSLDPSSDLQAIAAAVGHIYLHISSGEPLPEDVLEFQVFRQFAKHYPSSAKVHGLPKFEQMVAETQTWSSETLNERLQALEKRLNDSERTPLEIMQDNRLRAAITATLNPNKASVPKKDR